MSAESNTIFQNLGFISAFMGWLIAQALKFGTHLASTRKIDFYIFVSTGGMPSSHSSMVSALATSIGLSAGWNSPLFALSLGFASVVMFDAQSFRRAAGQQARLLNQMVEELFKEHHFSEKKLAELLGHTRYEVFFGMLLGIAVAFFVHNFWMPS
jgi:acid phosphatase family membrane protein YuiD